MKDQTIPLDLITDALALEQNRLMRFLSEENTEGDLEVNALERNLAARGFGRGGQRYSGEAKIRLGIIEKVITRMIALRMDIGRTSPQLLERGQLVPFQQKLEKLISGSAESISNHMAARGVNPGDAVLSAIRKLLENEGRKLSARLQNDIAALELSARLGLYLEYKPMQTHIYISDSNVGNINLAPVIGSITASIQALPNQAAKELAKQLTEGIESAQEIEIQQKKDLLDHLSVVTSEAAADASSRKMSVLKTSYDYLKSGLSGATNLLKLWNEFEQSLRSAGIDS